jgi:hypothetical protein
VERFVFVLPAGSVNSAFCFACQPDCNLVGVAVRGSDRGETFWLAVHVRVVVAAHTSGLVGGLHIAGAGVIVMHMRGGRVARAAREGEGGKSKAQGDDNAFHDG